MDPFTIAALSSIGMSLFGAYGQIEQGKAEMEAAKYNANILGQQAGQIREKSKRDAELTRSQGTKEISEMRTNFAASGIQVAGSALDVLAESAKLVKRDELTVRYEGEMNARAKEADAKRVLIEGKNAERAARLNATSQLLGGGVTAFKAFG